MNELKSIVVKRVGTTNRSACSACRPPSQPTLRVGQPREGLRNALPGHGGGGQVFVTAAARSSSGIDLCGRIPFVTQPRTVPQAIAPTAVGRYHSGTRGRG
jgi:hypothetical protein